MKLRNRFLYQIAAPLIIGLIITNYYTIVQVKQKHREVLFEKLEVINQSIQKINTVPLWNLDDDTLKVNLQSFLQRPEILEIAAFDGDEERVRLKEKSNSKADIKYELPISYDNKRIGYIEVRYSTNNIDDKLSFILNDLYYVQLIFIVIIAIIVYFVSRTLYLPMLEVVKAIDQLDKGELNFRLKMKKTDEFTLIEKSFNKLINNIVNEREKNEDYVNDLKKTKNELETAYNKMISINGVLESTLVNLELSENKYKNIFRYSPIGIVIYNKTNSEIKEYNQEYLDIFDIQRATSIVNELPPFAQDLIKTFLEKDVEKFETEIYYEELNKNIAVSLMLLKTDKEFIQIFFNDITEIKEMQLKLQNYANNLEKEVALRTKDLQEANSKIKTQQKKLVEEAYNKGLIEVTSGIIHNIGNVVNIVNLNLYEIERSFEEKDRSGTKFLKDILTPELKKIDEPSLNLEKMIMVIPELANVFDEFDKEVSAKFKFLQKKISHLKEIVQLQQNFVGSLGTENFHNINSIVEEVLEVYSSSIEKRSIKLNVFLQGNSKILCDKSQIIQLLGNLIKNAYEAIELAGVRGIIDVVSREIDNSYVLEIKDNGIGIEEENLPHLFDFGFSTKKESGLGSGFGLHSCKEIVTKYRGQIVAESIYNEETTFTIIFPLTLKGDLW